MIHRCHIATAMIHPWGHRDQHGNSNDSPVGGAGGLGWPARLGSQACRSFASPSPRSTSRSATSPVTRGPSSTGPHAPPSAGAHLAVFPEMALTGYPAEDLVLRRSFVGRLPRRARPGSPPTSPTAGSGEVAVVVGYLDACEAAGAAPGPPAGRAAERRRAPARRAGSSRATPSTTCPTTASSTSSATSCPATALPVVRLHGVDVAMTICEDLWQDGGPIRGLPAGRRRPACSPINGSPYERNKDDVRCELVRRARRRGRSHPRLRQHGRRPGRAGLRRRLASSSPRRATCSRARRSSSRRCSWSTSDRGHRRADRRPRLSMPATARPCASSGSRSAPTHCRRTTPRAAPGRAPARRPGRGLRRRRHRHPRLRPQERLPVGRPRACPAASTPR